jgi:hypothetical protein
MLTVMKISAWNDKSLDECITQWANEDIPEDPKQVAKEYGWVERDYSEEPQYRGSWKDLFKFY